MPLTHRHFTFNINVISVVDYSIHNMFDKPAVNAAPSRLVVLGRYIIMPEIFPILENTAPGRSCEIQLTDVLQVLAQRQSMYAYDFIGRRYDVGDTQGYLRPWWSTLCAGMI